MKIAMLFPYAPAYRGPIYELMDKELEIDWYFCGNAKRPMKLYDYSRLKHCNLSMREKKIIGPIVYFRGIKEIEFDKYAAIIIPSGIRNPSLWWLVNRYGRKNIGTKVFFWTHGWYGKEKGLMKLIKRVFYSKVDGVFLYNNRGKEKMIKNGFDETQLYVIYNSLDYGKQLGIRHSLQPSKLYQIHFGNDNPNVVFIGRLTKVKRFDLLIEAISLLKKKGEFVNLTFIGDGEERKNMERMIAEHGVTDQVWFYGACFDEKKNAELIYNADLCVSPGNIGLTAMHVLMFGCPAITNDDFDTQMPEFEAVKEDKTGAFFKADDSKSLADSISSWFAKHVNDRETIRQNCYKEIDSHWNPEYQISVIKDALGM